MINVVRARAAAAITPGETIAMTKAQYGQMLDQIALGNAARIRLTNIRSIANAGADAAGLDATVDDNVREENR